MRWTPAVLLTNGTGADGEVVWSWRPDAGVKLAEIFCRRQWQESPVTGESAKETVKTIARGKPVESGVTVVTTSCAHLFLHARLRVQRAPGFPCALCSRGWYWQSSGVFTRRDRAGVCAGAAGSPRPACGERSETARSKVSGWRGLSAGPSLLETPPHPLARCSRPLPASGARWRTVAVQAMDCFWNQIGNSTPSSRTSERKQARSRTHAWAQCAHRDAAASRWAQVADTFHNHEHRWVWVPAFAGTTNGSRRDRAGVCDLAPYCCDGGWLFDNW